MKNIIDIINKWEELQSANPTLCPKCGEHRIAPSIRAISRRADIVICHHCAAIEGFEDWLAHFSDPNIDLRSEEYNERCLKDWYLRQVC